MPNRPAPFRASPFRRLALAGLVAVRVAGIVAAPVAGIVAAPVAGIVAAPVAAWAQSKTPGGMPPPTGMSLAQSTAMRFPQPVHVGTLTGRPVLQPVESQTVLGTLEQVVRDPAGTLSAVIAFGGWLGFGQRLIAVPLDGMVLLGDVTEVVAFKPEQLRALPTFVPAGTTPLPPDATVRMGLAKPSH